MLTKILQGYPCFWVKNNVFWFNQTRVWLKSFSYFFLLNELSDYFEGSGGITIL